MRIIHTDVKSLVTWLESNPEPSVARRTARKFLAQAIIHGDCNRELLKKVISTIKEPKSLVVLEAFASSVLISSTGSVPQGEKFLRPMEGVDLEHVIESEQWDEAISRRSDFIEAGSIRDEEFGRVLGRLISLPNQRIELIDQYLGEKIVKSETVFTWLLKAISQRHNRHLVIHTKFPQDAFDGALPGTRNKERIGYLINQVEKAAAEVGYGGDVTLVLYTRTQHDRYWKFDFSEGFLALQNGHGLDAFKNEKLNASSSFHEENPDLWNSVLGVWRGTSVLYSSRVKGFESRNVVVEAPEFAFK